MEYELSVHLTNRLPNDKAPLGTMLQRRLEAQGISVHKGEPEEAASLRIALTTASEDSYRRLRGSPSVVFLLGSLTEEEELSLKHSSLSWPLEIPLPSGWDQALEIAVPVIWGLLEMKLWNHDTSAAWQRQRRLLSRDELVGALDVEWRRGLRSGESISVILFDCGDVGAFDEPLLEEAANYLSGRVRRAGDSAFRFDVRTLGACVAGCPPEEAAAFAEVLAADLGEMIMGPGETLALACTTAVPHPGSDPFALLEEARATLSGSL